MKPSRYYRQPDSHPWHQILQTATEYGNRSMNIVLASFWLLLGLVFLGMNIAVIYHRGSYEASGEQVFGIAVWFACIAGFLAGLVHPQCLIAKKLGLPNFGKYFFLTHLLIITFVILIPMGFFCFLFGIKMLWALSFCLLVMTYSPARLVNMDSALTFMIWLWCAAMLSRVYLSIMPSEFTFWDSIPLNLISFFVVLTYWSSVWWQVLQRSFYNEKELEQTQYLQEHGTCKSSPPKFLAWLGSTWDGFCHRKLKRLTADQFWHRFRLRLICYSSTEKWLQLFLPFVIMAYFMLFSDNSLEQSLEKLLSNRFYFLCLVAMFPGILATFYIARWREMVVFQHLLPQSHRDFIRESAFLFGLVTVRYWLFYAVLWIGVSYLLLTDYSFFEIHLSALIFSIAFLSFQYGTSILMMLVREDDFSNYNLFWCIATFLLFAGFWFLLDWTGEGGIGSWGWSVVLLVLGLVVSVSAYRRLHSFEIDQIGKRESL